MLQNSGILFLFLHSFVLIFKFGFCFFPFVALKNLTVCFSQQYSHLFEQFSHQSGSKLYVKHVDQYGAVVLTRFTVPQNTTPTTQGFYRIKGNEFAISWVLGMKIPMYNIQILFSDLGTIQRACVCSLHCISVKCHESCSGPSWSSLLPLPG